MLMTMTKNMKNFRIAALVAVLPLAACTTWRWSGAPPRESGASGVPLNTRSAGGDLHPMPVEAASAAELHLSSAPAVAKPRVILPPTPSGKLKAAAYPADLGPETVDISAYPLRIRADYKIYARVCSKCHTLARANYSKNVERGWWELYITNMRARAAWKGARLSRDEVRAILDFLEYDSRVRKHERATEFEQTNEELERRFNAATDAKMQRMQKGHTVLEGQ